MKYTMSVLVENQPGVLSRVSGLFSRRGFNIDSLAVGGDCPADCPAQPDGNRIADLLVFVQQTAFDHPIVGKFLNPFVFLYGQGPVFRRVRQFRCGHGGMGDYRGGRRIPVQPSVKARFPTAQMVGCLF